MESTSNRTIWNKNRFENKIDCDGLDMGWNLKIKQAFIFLISKFNFNSIMAGAKKILVENTI